MNKDIILAQIIAEYEAKVIKLQSELRHELIQNNIICSPFVEITIHDMETKLLKALKTKLLSNDNGQWLMFVSENNIITIHGKQTKNIEE